MAKRFLYLLFALLLVMNAGVLYGGDRTIVYNLGADPKTIDPAINNTLDGGIVIENIFEGLVIQDNGVFKPACAESWNMSEDGLTYTFKLRGDLKWSDGKELTAEDFAYGFVRVCDPENASPYANYGFIFKNGEKFYNGQAKIQDVGVHAPDKHTLIIELEYKNPLFFDYIVFHVFRPARRDVVEANPRGWAAKPETCISNGAFMLESWKHGDGGEVVVVKNPYYYDADNVKIDRVRMVNITDGNTALAAFKSGRIDYMTNMPPQMLPMLMKRGEIVSDLSLGVQYVAFNNSKAPFNNELVRRAFALAIDRKVLVDKITLGGQMPALGFAPYGIIDITPDKDFRTEGGEFLPETADIEQAKKLLAEAGYPNGENFPEVTYKYNSNPVNKTIAEALQGMWKKNLNINVKLYNEEWKVFIDSRNKGDFEIARSGWALDFMDAVSILETFTSTSANNYHRYSNPEFDELIRKSASEMDHAKRVNYLHEAEKILMRDLPGVPLFFNTDHHMQSQRVKNIKRNFSGLITFKDAELVK